MKRRQLVALVGAGMGASTMWPLRTVAQQPGKVKRIGFLGVDPTAWRAWTAAFAERLNTLGWIDGRTVAVEYRWAQGKIERYPEIASEFVRLNTDVIVTSGAAVPALMRAAPNIPVVFAVSNDPVAAGLVASLARPGGKVTGTSLQAPELAAKRLQLLREVIPRIRRLAVMADAGFPQAVLEMREVQGIARGFGAEVTTLEIRRAEDIPSSFEALKQQRPDALYVVINELLNASRGVITGLAKQARLPSIFGTRDWAQSGGLMSYGPNFPDLFRRAAELVDMILRGRDPGEIPVEQARRFELVINLPTATELGLKIPHSLLVRAEEVIQ